MHKCHGKRKMSFVKFSQEKIGDLYPSESSHELLHFGCCWNFLKPNLSLVFIWALSKTEQSLLWDTINGLPKSLLRVSKAVVKNILLQPMASTIHFVSPSSTLYSLIILVLLTNTRFKWTLLNKFLISSCICLGYNQI